MSESGEPPVQTEQIKELHPAHKNTHAHKYMYTQSLLERLSSVGKPQISLLYSILYSLSQFSLLFNTSLGCLGLGFRAAS
jgi:hypothetical protein